MKLVKQLVILQKVQLTEKHYKLGIVFAEVSVFKLQGFEKLAETA